MKLRPLAALLLGGLSALLAQGAPEEIVFASYNLENFVGDDTLPENAAGRRTPPKTEKAIAAVVRIIREISPDILGVCEMGSPQEFALFQKRLRECGLDYPETEYVQAADPDRHLALLSRFPIVARASETDLAFDLNGVPRHMSRGILDVTIRPPGAWELRLVGVHLKSRLAVREGEETVRRHEAALLRHHCEGILSAAPKTNLLLYGDLNDTRNTPAIQEIAGPRGALHLTDLPARDEQGDRWTQYWKVADLYSRIDYLFASPALLRAIVPGRTGISRSAGWNDASDHRLIFTAILPSP